METDWIREYTKLINALYLELDYEVCKDLDQRLKALINRIEARARLELVDGIRDYLINQKQKLQYTQQAVDKDKPETSLEHTEKIYVAAKVMGELELINALLPLLQKGTYATK